MDSIKITTEMLDKALLEKYKEPEYYFGFEVGNSCGSEVKRHADAIAICAYPSRGFVTIGFEVKVSKSDLQHELDNPQKCEEMYQYVNEWFLVVPKGMIDDITIPEPWGIMEYEDGKLRQKRKPSYHDAKLTKGFMVAFIRGRQRANRFSYVELLKDAKKQVMSELKWKTKSDSEELKRLKENISKIEKETGIHLDSYFTDENVHTIKIAKNISEKLGYRNYCIKKRLEYGVNQINESVDNIKKAYELLLEMIDSETNKKTGDK